MERWSQEDKNVYGAEDDEDMDMILRALDQASERDQPEPADTPS